MKNFDVYPLKAISDSNLIHICQLEQQLFPDDSWEISALQDIFLQDYNHLFVIQDNEKIIAYCIVQVMFDTAEILRIGVEKTYQGQGLAKQLLIKVVEFLQTLAVERLLLEVRADNMSAIALYKNLGFEQISIRKNYYRLQNNLTVDALILQKSLNACVD